MFHNVDPIKVERAVGDTLRSLNGLGMGEVLVVLAEATGRMIVNVCDTPVQMDDMRKVVDEHMRRTLAAGMSAKGFNTGGM